MQKWGARPENVKNRKLVYIESFKEVRIKIISLNVDNVRILVRILILLELIQKSLVRKKGVGTSD